MAENDEKIDTVKGGKERARERDKKLGGRFDMDSQSGILRLDARIHQMSPREVICLVR